MSSTFDTVSTWDTVYGEVMALYAAIKDTPGCIRVRRAEMRQGEVQAEPLDFIIDVELKAKRVILEDPDPEYAMVEWFRVLDNPEQYPFLPVAICEALGQAFNMNRLGVDGDYRMLYFKVKNHHHEITQEVANGIFE